MGRPAADGEEDELAAAPSFQQSFSADFDQLVKNAASAAASKPAGVLSLPTVYIQFKAELMKLGRLYYCMLPWLPCDYRMLLLYVAMVTL